LPKGTYEILIIDGSTNNLVSNFVANYLRKYNFVRYIKRSGCNLPEALNLGIKNMRGRFFKQLDDDDILVSGAIKKYLEYANNHKNYLIFYSDAYTIDEHNNIVGKEDEDSYNKRELITTIWSRSIGVPSSYMINKDAFKIVGMFNSKMLIAEDWEWRLRAIIVKKLMMYHIPIGLIKYRRHKSQKSYKEMLSAPYDMYKIRKQFLSTYAHNIDKSILKDLKISRVYVVASVIKRYIEFKLRLKENKYYRKFIRKIELLFS
jgi:glycosyltransferase involved in cell wall biosynthesis